MKKTIALILITAFILSFGTLAYAQSGSTDNGSGGNASVEQQVGDVQQKIQAGKDLKDQMEPQTNRIRNNRTEILGLRNEVQAAHQEAVMHIQQLRQNQDCLTDEQVEALRLCLQTLQQNRLQICETVGDIQSEGLKLRQARREQNTEQMQACLENMAAVQEARIKLLEASLEDINDILDI